MAALYSFMQPNQACNEELFLKLFFSITDTVNKGFTFNQFENLMPIITDM